MMTETIRRATVYTTRDEAYIALSDHINHEYVAEHRAKAKALRAEAEESFQRCDTDGALSQVCAGISAQGEEARDSLDKHNGMAVFRVLVNEAGELVSTKLFSFANRFAHWKVSNSWLVPSPTAPATKDRWISDDTKEATMNKKGFFYGWIVGPGYVSTTDPLDRTPVKYGTGNLHSVRYKTLLDREKGGYKI